MSAVSSVSYVRGEDRGTTGGRFRRRGAVAGCACLVLLVACGGGDPPQAQEAPAERPALVRTAPPAVEKVVDLASLPADLLPLRRAVLAAEVAGVVESLHFEDGQWVEAGRLLAQIDTRALEQVVAETEALANLAREQARRAESLFAKRSITEQQLLDAATEREVAEARLASARLDLSKSRLQAPWAGRIAERRVEVGDFVAVGQPVAVLLDSTRLKVRSPAPAADVPYLRVGAPVTIRVDAFPGETFEGRVVRLAAEVDPGARTLDVEAEIPNPGERLKPGLPARMELPRRTLEEALLVPLEAVVDLGEADVVYVVEGDRARRRAVELGPVSGARVVIASGLAPGERVVVEGAQQIADGQLVTEAEATPDLATLAPLQAPRPKTRARAGGAPPQCA